MPTRPEPPTTAPEGRGAFGGFIGPRTLVGQVKTTAPYLFDRSAPLRGGALEPDLDRSGATSRRLIEHGFEPLGWWKILLAAELLPAREHPSSSERADYFALCLAAHFASAATYVPTDVDAKIRHALWFEDLAPDDLARMRDLTLHLVQWDMRGISARSLDVEGEGAVSGHDGERLSVLCGGMLGLFGAGDVRGAESFETAIDDELAREARAFDALLAAPGRECDLLRAAAILTHNAGDVRQGLGAKSGRDLGGAQKERFADLAQSGFERYGGAYGRAAALYRELLASEGHRNYPLREVKALRADPALLLPIGPFLDEWGETLARWPRFRAADRADIVTALIDGCRKVKGQESYYRALAGFDAVHPGGIESRELAEHYGSAVKRELRNPELRKKIAVRRESFESSYKKRTRTIARAPLAALSRDQA